MKKIIAITLLSVMLFSCSDDDSDSPTSTEESFFNLAEGNIWVYKRYRGIDATTPAEFTNTIDSVRVTGTAVIDGENYYRLSHREYNSGLFSSERDEFLRVNTHGHLVNGNGFVVHPGIDATYQFTDVTEYGNVHYQLETQITTEVEDATYLIYPYVGYFDPAVTAIPEGLGCVFSYQSGVGLIVSRNRFVPNTGYFEDRLVHYEVQ